eukprot:evm.model.scf_402.1 EVM.evm.TU.scf_402.1   scf_402:212-5356(+)
MADRPASIPDEGLTASRRKVRPRPLRLGDPVRVVWMGPRGDDPGLLRIKSDNPALYEFLTSPEEMAGLVKHGVLVLDEQGQPMKVQPFAEVDRKDIPVPRWRPVEPKASGTAWGSNSWKSYDNEPYIRQIAPSDDELNAVVEYTLDNSDEAWLRQFNKLCRKPADKLSADGFETIVDTFEKLHFKAVQATPLCPGSIPGTDLLPFDAAAEQLSSLGFSIAQVEGVHQYWVQRRNKWSRPLLDRLCYEMPWNAILHAHRRRRNDTEDVSDNLPTPFLHHFSPKKDWIRRAERMTEQERYDYMWHMRDDLETARNLATQVELREKLKRQCHNFWAEGLIAQVQSLCPLADAGVDDEVENIASQSRTMDNKKRKALCDSPVTEKKKRARQQGRAYPVLPTSSDSPSSLSSGPPSAPRRPLTRSMGVPVRMDDGNNVSHFPCAKQHSDPSCPRTESQGQHGPPQGVPLGPQLNDHFRRAQKSTVALQKDARYPLRSSKEGLTGTSCSKNPSEGNETVPGGLETGSRCKSRKELARRRIVHVQSDANGMNGRRPVTRSRQPAPISCSGSLKNGHTSAFHKEMAPSKEHINGRAQRVKSMRAILKEVEKQRGAKTSANVISKMAEILKAPPSGNTRSRGNSDLSSIPSRLIPYLNGV